MTTKSKSKPRQETSSNTSTENSSSLENDEQNSLGNSGILSRNNSDGGGDDGEPSPEEIAAEVAAAKVQLHKACDGWGTDEDLVFDTLRSLSPEAKRAMAKDQEAMDLLDDDLSKKEFKTAMSLLQTTGEKNVDQFTADLGSVEGYSGLTEVLGAFLETLAPLPGRVFMAKVKISIAPPAGFGLDLEFGIEGERTEAGFALKLEAGIFVGFVTNLGILKAKVGAKITASAAMKGDSGAECLALLGLGLYTKVSDWLGESAANKVFSTHAMDEIVANMDEDVDESEKPEVPPEGATPEQMEEYEKELKEYNEKKAEADSITLSFGVGGEAGVSGEDGTDLSMGMGYEGTQEIKKKNGELESVKKNWLAINFKLVVQGYGIECKIRVNPGENELKLQAKGIANIPIHTLGPAAVQQAVAGIVQGAVGAIKNSGEEGAESAAVGIGNAFLGADYTALNAVPSIVAEQGAKETGEHAAEEILEGKLENELEVELETRDGNVAKAGLALKLMSVYEYKTPGEGPVSAELSWGTGLKIELL